MVDIEKVALEYLNANSFTKSGRKMPKERRTAKRKTRKALLNSYDKIRQKYVEEKNKVENIVGISEKLKKEYEKRLVRMERYHSDMTDLREKLQQIDDDGVDFFEFPEESEESAEEEIGSEDSLYPHYRSSY